MRNADNEFRQMCLVSGCEGVNEDILDISDGHKECKKCGAKFALCFSAYVSDENGVDQEVFRQVIGEEGKVVNENLFQKGIAMLKRWFD